MPKTQRLRNRFLLPTVAMLMLALASSVSAAPAKTPAVGQTLPAFTLADTDGKQVTFSQQRGTAVALFFFCGCPWCTKCAQQWGQFQRGGVLAAASARPASASVPAPPTLIVFTGNAAAARAFAVQTGLDLKQTRLLPDPAMRVTTDLYHADPCPRVFVAGPGGRLRYTNSHADDAPRQASALVITSRALQALRAADAINTAAAPKLSHHAARGTR